jgi:sec-independent protein translocase protein TatB
MDFGLFGIGLPQILLIMVVALIVFGPDRLPGIARQAGRWVNDLRRLTQEARGELSDLTKELDLREDLKSVQADLAEIKKDLVSTTQDLTKDFQDLKKEVDLKETIEAALEQKPEVVVPPATVSSTSLDTTAAIMESPLEDTLARQSLIQEAVHEMTEAKGDLALEASDLATLNGTLEQATVAPEVAGNGLAVTSNGDLVTYNSSLAGSELAGSVELNNQPSPTAELQEKIEALEAQMQNTRSDLYQRLASMEALLTQRLDRLEERLAAPSHPGPS